MPYDKSVKDKMRVSIPCHHEIEGVSRTVLILTSDRPCIARRTSSRTVCFMRKMRLCNDSSREEECGWAYLALLQWLKELEQCMNSIPKIVKLITATLTGRVRKPYQVQWIELYLKQHSIK